MLAIDAVQYLRSYNLVSTSTKLLARSHPHWIGLPEERILAELDHFNCWPLFEEEEKTVYTLKVSTNLKYLSWTIGCHNLPSITSLPSTTSTTPSTSTSTISPSPMATPDLAVTLWRAYPDTAVFDWLITLQVRKRPIAARKEAQHIRELF